MQYIIPLDIEQLISDQLSKGRYANVDEILRKALQALQRLDDDSAAIQEAVDDWKRGDDGVGLDQAFAMVREEFGQRPAE